MNKFDLILKKAEQETLALKHPYVGTEHLLLAILKSRSKLVEFLRKQGVTYKKFKNQLIKLIGQTDNNNDYTLYTPMLRCVLNDSLEYAKKNNQQVDEIILFNTIIESKEGIAVRILETMHIDLEKLKYQEIINYPYCTILNNKVMDEKLVGRDLELANIIQILLRKNKCNPLLIGKAGVGKTALVEELARKINKKEVPKELMDVKILRLDLASLVAGTKYRGEFEEKVTKLVNDVKNNKNIILFVDEIHTLVNAGGSEGAIGAGDIFKPFLARGEIRLIGATTLNEYHKFIEPDKALSRRMTSVILEEPSAKETLNILLKIKDVYEKYHGVKIDNDIVKLIVELTTKYLLNKANPDKSIELLDSLCSYVKFQNKLQVSIDDVYSLFNNKYYINFLGSNNPKLVDFLNKQKCLVSEDFNFEGKDGSSFISSVLADVLIAADPNDQYTDYESLIGSKMIYELNGDSYAFSINNIYRADTWFGPSVSATFQYPFITDCDRLYLNNDISLFASSMGDFGEFSELIYQLALQEDNGLDFGCYFVKSVNEKEPYPEEAYLVNLIKHASDSGSSLINGNNIPTFTMLVVLLVLNLIASVYIGYKFTFSKWKSGLAIASATSLLFILISGLLFIIFGAGLKASIILNPVYGGIGVLMPFVILGIALLVGKIKKGHFKI